MNEDKKIVVIGGSNRDYFAKSSSPLIYKDSNVGHISSSNGGVGRNIALNLAYLNNDVDFITALGDDEGGRNIKSELIQHNVNVITPSSIYQTSSYLAILNLKGDMEVAICDTQILDNLCFCQLDPLLGTLNDHKHVIIDTNLNQGLIDDLFLKYKDHYFYVEGVSCTKIQRIKNHLKDIYLLKCNYLEATSLLNEHLPIEESIKKILSLGVKKVVVSNSSNNIYFGKDNKVDCISIEKKDDVVSTSGAGDALFAGIIHSLNNNKSLKESVIFGNKVALLTLEVEGNINPSIAKLIK